MVENSQLTVMFHVDNLIIACKMLNIVIDLIKLLDSVYGTQDPLTVTRRKVYEYLGITINFLLKRDIAFSQYDFVKKF